MISLFDRLVQGGNVSLAVAELNMQRILEALADETSDNIAVDVKGPILLAPYTDPDNVTHVTLDGNPPPSQIPFRGNRAIKCLTFDYGASFATHPAAGTNISLVNVQIEADEKAFLFQTIDTPTIKQINVTEVFNTLVSVCWFGAVAQNAPNPATAPDSYPAFMAAIACFQRQPVDPINRVEWNFTVRVPATVGNASVYVISQMIVIDSNVSLFGDGKVKTYLTFFNTSGFLIVGNQVGFNSGGQSIISDLNFQCIKTLPITLNNHGVIVHSTVNLLNVTINGFDGDGIHIDTSNNAGNAILSRFINVTCQSNLRNGIFITGNKSNNILFEHVAVLDNGACGIREEFSLQNTYLNCVAEANSLTNNNQSRVSFLIDNVNHYFICIRDITTPGVGQNPLNTNFWREFGTAGGEVTDVYPEWSSTKSYLMSFAYALCVAGNASRSVMSGCYAENNQLSIYNNPYSGNGNIIIGGQISNPSSIDGMIYNDRGAITSNKFGTNRPLTDLVIPDNSNLNNPWYLIGGTNLKSGIGYESKGGYLIGNLFANRKNPDGASYKPLYLSYQFIQQYSSFGYRLDTGGENERSPLMFVIKESVEKYPAMYGAARGFTEKDCYSCFLSPTFHRIIDNGAQVAVRYLGFSNNVPTVGNYTKGDFFLNPNSNTNTVRRPIGWRCITSTTSTTPAVWETLHYFQPAEEMVLNTQPASETYSQSQMQNLIDVVNELINKLTAAGTIES